MDTNEVNEKFEDIIRPKIINQVVKAPKPPKTPAKFPEVRWFLGISAIVTGVSFALSFSILLITATVITALDSF
jgi:hypothetical protein